MTTPAEQKLIELQQSFAAAIRNGTDESPPGGVPETRMAVYRELFLRNIEGALESAFPVAVEVLAPNLWQKLVSQFWRSHRSNTPEYPRMAREFLIWLEGVMQIPAKGDIPTAGAGEAEASIKGSIERANDAAILKNELPPWLLELLVWEHAELDSFLAPDDSLTPCAADIAETVRSNFILTQKLEATLSLNVFAFSWPVHRIGVDWQPTAPEPTLLACFRSPALEIEFIELMPASALLLESIRSEPSATVEAHLQSLAEVLGTPVADMRGFAVGFLSDLVSRGALCLQNQCLSE